MTAFDLLGERDLWWISDVVDIVEQTVGRPWRDALDRLDDLQRAAQPTEPKRYGAVVGAVQRITGGRKKNAQTAREARSLVLGHPVFGAIERQARIAWAAQELAVTPAMLETLLWCDLPRERPVELPYGRPAELEVAAFANVALIQRMLRRAQSVTLTIADDAGPVMRASAQVGLLATASITHIEQGDRPATVIDIVGPLALFHRTNVYGRALADLVPLLGELRAFSLEVHVETQNAIYTRRIDSPVLLPAPPPRLAALPYPVARLAKGLARVAPELAVTPLPPPLYMDSAVVCPDLLIERGSCRCFVEIVGFWTAAHVERKLASYRAAGVDVIVCLDASGACDERDAPDGAVLFRKHVIAEQIVQRLDGEWGSLSS